MYDEYEDYELYAHKRSDKVKWVVSFLLIFVLLAGLIGAWVLLLKLEESTPEQDEGGAVITEGESSGIKLMSVKIPAAQYEEYGISPLADTAYQLTATIIPENATDKTVDWTIAWAESRGEHTGGTNAINPVDSTYDSDDTHDTSNSWSEGKTVTDYVTVTPTSDGALTANVECLKDFGAQVKVTVTSRDNSDVKANCLVDYTQKLQGVKATFGSTVLTDGIAKSFDLSQSGQPIESWKFDYTTSAYTIEDHYVTMVTLSFAEEGVSALESTIGAEFTWETDNISGGMPAFDKRFFDRVFVTADGAVSENAEQYNKLVAALSSGVTLFEAEVFTAGDYGTKTDVYKIMVTSDGLKIRVEGMELDDTSLIF